MTHSSSSLPADTQRPSKSQRKRDMLALQDLGNDLVDLPAQQLGQLSLDPALVEAIHEARRITSREGRRRQLQYVGRLMRNADADAIRERLEAWRQGSVDETRALHQLEALRDRLIDDDDALTAYLDDHPDIDIQSLRALIRSARSEAHYNTGLNPGETPRRRYYRALFQALKDHGQDLP